jgi:hypothetical protein
VELAEAEDIKSKLVVDEEKSQGLALDASSSESQIEPEEQKKRLNPREPLDEPTFKRQKVD